MLIRFLHLCHLAVAVICVMGAGAATAEDGVAFFKASEAAPHTVSLKGEWGFVWGALLSPTEAHRAFVTDDIVRAPVPARWQDFLPKSPNNPFLHGVATYVAPVEMPETDASMVLALSAVLEAYRIYWVPLDQPEAWHLVAEEGHVQGPPLAAIRNQAHEFHGQGKGLLVIQVRKDVFGWSGINSWNGIRHKPEITPTDVKMAERIGHELILGIAVGIIMFTMAQNLLLFSINRTDKAPLYLAVGCLLVAMRALILWDKVELWFGAEWFILRMRLEMLNIVVASSMLMGLNKALLPSFYPQWIMRFVMTLVAGLGVFIVAAPPDVMSAALPVYQLHSLFVCGASFWGIARAIINREKGASFVCFALSILVIGAVHDIFSVIVLAYELLLVEYAFVGTMVCYTFLIGQRFAQSQRRADSLMAERATLQRMHRAAVNSARIDHLTGLLNRQAFDHEFALAWEKMAATHTAVSVVLFDIDHFKQVNDTHGHPVGDVVLRCLGETLKEAQMRRHDKLCRYGGEEFAIILPDTSEEEAARIAERLRAEIAAMHIALKTGTILRVSCSFGVAQAKSPTTSVGELLSNADDALYAAKRSGRNRVQRFSGHDCKSRAA
ncbi:GGDEF domain-containing protein [Shimia haliotis]|uniref:diguanylate cyclase n=1 Tax=Shimia haliotis TaxID=1280847 RepID=A0A1I4A3U1_9RHOB|nr:diguanylate cyclase [Shimia haliotis]SFK50439.1 diguanylate cyclase (GGDEF) domain-containing protein [Shimia haliotis]